MPLKSLAQARWMHATHPAMAKRWEAETPNRSKLPARVKKKSPGAKTMGARGSA